MVAVPSGQLILVVPFELIIRVVLPSALISFEEPSGLVNITVPSAFVSFFIPELMSFFSVAFIEVPSRAILYLVAPSMSSELLSLGVTGVGAVAGTV